MSELYKSSKDIGSNNIESKEGERGLLYSNKANVRSPSLGIDEINNSETKLNPNALLNPKTIEIFTGFAVTLKKIHIRLIMEGYTIKNGKIYKPGEYKEHETGTKHNSKNT